MRLLRPTAAGRGRRSGQGSTLVGRIVVLSAVLLCAFVVGVVIGQTGGDDMVSASALQDETGKVDQLRNQVAQLEGDLRTVREQLQQAQASSPPSTAGDPNSAASDEKKSSKSSKDSASSDDEDSSSKSTTKSGDDSSSASTDGKWTTYTVQSGENLWSVSKNVYGTTGYWKLIATNNDLTSKSELRTGQKLKIPPKPKSGSTTESSSNSSSGSSSSEVD